MRILSALLAITALLFAMPAAAQEVKAGALTLAEPWTRATPPAATVGAGYLRITNKGTAPDRLIGVAAPFAGRGEVHEMTMTGGIMRMREIAGGLAIAPGATVELKPGGNHLMFVDLKAPLQQGATVPVTLTFEKAGKVEVPFAVRGVGGR